jgi:hypothetical protein
MHAAECQRVEKVANTKNCASFFVRIVSTLVAIAGGGGGDVQTARRVHPEVSSRANLSTGIQRKSKYFQDFGPPLTHAFDSVQIIEVYRIIKVLSP